FAQRGLRSAGMKPVAAGCAWQDGRLLSEDVVQLVAASNVEIDLDLINPYAFAPPIAPHIAADKAGVIIELPVIQRACKTLRGQVDRVMVEGVGGFRVPLGADIDTADLAQALGLPVVLVVGMRLGCINHTLLTLEAIEVRGLTLAGWVANCIDSEMAALDDNIAALRQRIPAPCLGIVPTLGAADFRLAATYLQLDQL
ncbi:MAG TPA: dethiobiotin synthase, partial [Methylophilaceae bacterium]|nr:dethiobiotin synthase [Methylophilaceae bacterium]